MHILGGTKKIPDDSVDCIGTSPPYWGLRDYGEETNTIWDGNPGCEHKWGNEIKHKIRGSSENANVGSNKKECQPKELKQGFFCSKCNAWYGQLGLEPTLDMYLNHLLQITAELKRILKPTGVMFWNHGDCYGGSCSWGGQTGVDKKWDDKRKIHPPGYHQRKSTPKCLTLQNYRLILRMIDEQDWFLRNTLIWHKPNAMPSSVKDRFSNTYEPVFMLVKNKRYWFDLDAIRVPHKQTSIDRLFRGVSETNKYSGNVYGGNQPSHTMNKPRKRIPKDIRPGNKEEQYHEQSIIPSGGSNKKISNQLINLQKNILEGVGRNPGDVYTDRGDTKFNLDEAVRHGMRLPPEPSSDNAFHPAGKNPGDFLSISTKGFPDAHFAVFPDTLIEPFIKAACPDNGVVLDPFAGSGTTLKVANNLNRNAIGIEISPKYCDMIFKNIWNGHLPMDPDEFKLIKD